MGRMVNGFEGGLEIDRINVDGNYEPSNCRFVTKLENSRNRRVTAKVNYGGNELPLSVVAEKIGVKYQTLWARVNRKGARSMV